MCKSCCEELIQIHCACADDNAHPMHKSKVSALDEHQCSAGDLDLNNCFSSNKTNAFIDLIHTQLENKIIMNKMA